MKIYQLWASIYRFPSGKHHIIRNFRARRMMAEKKKPILSNLSCLVLKKIQKFVYRMGFLV